MPRPIFQSEPHPRRLGVGGGSARSERLVRAQVVIALVLGFTVLAVLLYLWRSPSSIANDGKADADAAPSASSGPAPAIVRTRVEPAKKVAPAVKVGAVQRVKCGSSPKLTGGQDTLCDSLPFFEQELARAIEQTIDCAPKQKEGGSINYVMAIDFRTQELRVYPGQSGAWRGKQAKKAAECVRRALSAPTWATISHQYRWYAIAMLATYPAQSGGDGLPSFEK